MKLGNYEVEDEYIISNISVVVLPVLSTWVALSFLQAEKTQTLALPELVSTTRMAG